MNNNNNDHVLITGGCSGIGLTLAKYYLQQGAAISLLDRELSSSATEFLEQHPQTSTFYSIDVTDLDSLKAAADQASQKLGKIDLVINSAGILIAAPFEQLAGSDFDRVVDINLKGSRNTCEAVYPYLTKGAHIVLIASMAGLVTNYSYAAYSASKYGVIGLAGCLRTELKPKGIDISVLCPPEIITPMVTQEQQTMHPVTKKLKATVGTMTLEQALPAIVKGIASRRFYIVVSFAAKFTWWLSRLIPSLSLKYIDWVTKAELKKHQL